MSVHNIMLGVSLYSMSSDYVKGRLDLEGCLKTIADMGFKGIEIVAAQMVPEYPHPSDRWLYHFKDLLDKYALTPVCYSAYIDYGLRTERDLNHDEIIQFTQNDMVYAKKAGFQMVRTQHSISPAILEEMVPFCEELDMKLTVEMHHPHHPKVPVWETYIKLMHRYPHLGMVPDLSIFQVKPHRLLLERLVRAGFRQDKLDEVVKYHAEGVSVKEAIHALALSNLEGEYTEALYEKFNPTPFQELAVLIPVAPYIHGKFYILNDGEFDPCIPYHEILPRIKALGYEGFIAAEYEGHHFDMSVDLREQLKNYASMFHKYLDGGDSDSALRKTPQ